METPMWNRLKAILADFIQQADLVLLGLCCAATLYGMALIASATRYLGTGGILRYVGVQGGGPWCWASAPISSCPCWTWSG